MTVRTLFATADLQEGWKAMRAPVPALLLGLIVLGLVFHEEIAAAVFIWYESTAYSHCYFIIPIAAYLAWDRRHSLASVPIVPLPWAALLALPLGAAWLVAERLGIMEGRQLVAMTLVEVLFLTVLGWRMCWALAAPLLYLYFLVPFGAFVTPKLQDFTTGFINGGLDFLEIPYNSDGYTIEIPEGRFYVAEACAGLRFLIASIAFGTLYACLMYRSFLRRALFMLASIIIPIIANGFRALGIVVLGHLLGSAQAAAADHILYGWLFFSIVILLLILAGLPFREDVRAKEAAEAEPYAGPPPASPAPRRLLFAAVLAAAFAVIGPATSAWLDRSAQPASAIPAPVFTAVAGCHPMSAGASAAAPDVAVQRFACATGQLTVTVQAFPPRSNPARVITAERWATGEFDGGDETVVSNLQVPGIEPDNWRLVLTTEPPRVTVAALWIDGKPATGGLAGRLAMARDSLAGSAYAPMLVTVSMQFPRTQMSSNDAQSAQRLIRAFLTAQGKFSEQISQLAMAAAR
jgi:exosortase A